MRDPVPGSTLTPRSGGSLRSGASEPGGVTGGVEAVPPETLTGSN